MVNFLRLCLTSFLFILFAQFSASAQNCTINAGVNETICSGQPFTLVGSATGLFSEPATWTQIGGPAVTISASTITAGQVTATVTGFSPGVAYTFRLIAKCTDGTPVSNDVVYTFSPLTVANAGHDTVACPGTINMTANAVKAGETGTWIVVSGNLPLPSPSNSPTGSVTLPQGSSGTTIYRWRITSGGTCTSTSEVTVTNIGGVTPVTASGPSSNVGCYTVTASANISGSYPGSGNGQTGTWSFISGPSTPTFGDIHANNTTLSNLTGGTYVVRWTVAGPCVNGSADVTIHVDNPTQDVTNAGGATLNYCDGRTSTELDGPKPLYTNETVLWTSAATNPPGVTISDPTSPTTTVSGLVPPNSYDFIYTITNSVTHCVSSGTYSVRYLTPPQFVTFPATPQILPTDTTQYNIVYTVSGGNATQWQLVSAPAGSIIVDSIGLNTVFNTSANNLFARGMNKPGSYVFRFRRYDNDASGGCSDAYKAIQIVVSRKPYQSNAGTSQFLACGVTTATLAGNAPPAGQFGSGTWTQISGPNNAIIVNKTSNTTLVTDLITGKYVFRWIISAGVNVADNTESDVDIIVAAPPTIVNAGPDITTCFGTPVKLNANVPQPDETGTWSVVSESPTTPVSTVTFSNVNDPKATVNGLLASKIYDLRWTISNSCGTIADDVNINTGSAAGPQQADAGPDQCLPTGTSSFTLLANAPTAGETGTWTLLPGAPNMPVFSTTANNQTVTGAINGTYTFQWTLSIGSCSLTADTVAVTISPATTTASITGAPLQSICSLNPITLTGNAPGAGETGLWTQVGSLGGAVITSPTSNVTTVTNLTNGSYQFRWTISNSACSSSSADITYQLSAPPPTADAGPNQTLCDATSTTLAGSTIVFGSGLWTVVSSPNTPSFSDVTDPHATLSNLVLGTYVLKWTVSNGTTCPTSSANVSITVTKSADAGPDQAICNETTTALIGNEGSTGTWTEVSGPNTVTITPNSNNTAEVTGLIPGTYTFRYTETAGNCNTPTDDMNVVVSGPPSEADAGPDQVLCTSNGTSVNLTAVPPAVGTGAWSFITQPTGSVATFSSTSAASTTVNNLTVPGTYIAQWQVTNANCTGAQSNNDIARIEVSAPPTVVQPMPPQTANCTNSVVLTGTTPIVGIGTWALVSGPNTPTITAPNSPTTTVSNLIVSATPYIFSWTITSGTCTPSTQNVSVTVTNNAPAIANAGTVPDQCTPSIGGSTSVTLAATNNLIGDDQGTWTVVSQPASSPTVTFTDVHSPTAVAGNLVAGPYTLRWTISNSSTCTSSSDVSFTIFDPPSTADAGASTAAYCLYSPVVLAATTPTNGTGTWTVISKPAGAGDPVFSSVTDPHATVDGLVLGTYDFRWTTSNGPCATSQDDITVTINDCEIAISKDAPSTPVPQPDGSFNVTFVFHVKNTGTVAVGNVQVQDDLTLTFPSPKSFTKVSVVGTGTLAVNNSFNGSSDTNLLVAGSSNLTTGDEETVTLVVNVKLN